jgi:hypothetical protein
MKNCSVAKLFNAVTFISNTNRRYWKRKFAGIYLIK